MIKVADFGLSQILGPEEEFFQQKDEDSVKLPMKWLAIESINERMFSEKTDVVRNMIEGLGGKIILLPCLLV